MGGKVFLTNWLHLTPAQPSSQYLIWARCAPNNIGEHTPFGLFPVQKGIIRFDMLLCDPLDREIPHKDAGLVHH